MRRWRGDGSGDVARPNIVEMRSRRTILAVAVLGGGRLTTVRSGEVDEASTGTVAQIQPTSYVVKELVTTTTTTLPPTTTTIPGQIAEAYEYTIQSNDNPSYVADLFSISLSRLAEANATNPDYSSFIIGGTVIIPAGAIMPGGLSTAAATDGTAQAGECTSLEHTIVEGDNPTVVAEQYGVTIADLARANATNATYTSFILGGTLTIPVGDC